MTHPNGLIIFVKNPRLGFGKSRIAETAGKERALQIYRALLAHTREVALAVHAHRYLYYSTFVDEADAWSAAEFRKALQPEGDLGARMEAAFGDVLQRHRRAVIIGSDCAQLTPAIVERGFAALATHDAVIGPATDGGYYLLGLNSLAVDVFRNMTWSVDTVGEQTIRRLEAAGRSVARLPTLSDIDTEADWARYGWPLGS